jgi:hypothetical protein
MDSLRIDTGTKKIQINDGPDFIEFNPSDIIFAEKFYDLISDFEIRMDEYQKRLNELNDNQNKDDYGVPLNIEGTLKLMREICDYLRERIDNIFGEGTSQKVFGDAMNLDIFIQFFDGLTPFIKTARTAKLAKYDKKPRAKRVMKSTS